MENYVSRGKNLVILSNLTAFGVGAMLVGAAAAGIQFGWAYGLACLGVCGLGIAVLTSHSLELVRHISRQQAEALEQEIDGIQSAGREP